MTILQTVDLIRDKARSMGNYRRVSKHSGVGYEWLAKFAQGAITNPKVENVAKLEVFFERVEKNPQDCPFCKQ